jgi:hypothetical protein
MPLLSCGLRAALRAILRVSHLTLQKRLPGRCRAVLSPSQAISGGVLGLDFGLSNVTIYNTQLLCMSESLRTISNRKKRSIKARKEKEKEQAG